LYRILYEEVSMQPPRLDEDIRPLSEFRVGVASFVKQVNDTGRPLILTQRGRGVAVVVGIREFEAMRERLGLLEDIARAKAQLAAGEGIPHEEARARAMDAVASLQRDSVAEGTDEMTPREIEAEIAEVRKARNR
jgi:antitoxin YefM